MLVLVDYINQHRHRSGVEPICAVLKDAGVQIAPSPYYAAKTRPLTARAIWDAELAVNIKIAHKANLGVDGVRKIHGRGA
ncbi:putative transposase [Bowdeniella nasicola]|uniref:Putative transposase n=2 Tax=Bowdeniella nasicola TaxID=208480 RepID=A0A1H4DUW3_9ACTO|nr:putative transposase [Bowdeniella nasicola]